MVQQPEEVISLYMAIPLTDGRKGAELIVPLSGIYNTRDGVALARDWNSTEDSTLARWYEAVTTTGVVPPDAPVEIANLLEVNRESLDAYGVNEKVGDAELCCLYHSSLATKPVTAAPKPSWVMRIADKVRALGCITTLILMPILSVTGVSVYTKTIAPFLVAVALYSCGYLLTPKGRVYDRLLQAGMFAQGLSWVLLTVFAVTALVYNHS